MIKRSVLDLKHVLNLLKESLQWIEEERGLPKYEAMRDSVVKRFEFTYDLYWKHIKDRLEEEKGVVVASPKEVFRNAALCGLMSKDEADLSLQMVVDRNATAHRYDDGAAEGVARRAQEYYKLVSDLLKGRA